MSPTPRPRSSKLWPEPLRLQPIQQPPGRRGGQGHHRHVRRGHGGGGAGGAALLHVLGLAPLLQRLHGHIILDVLALLPGHRVALLPGLP